MGVRWRGLLFFFTFLKRGHGGLRARHTCCNYITAEAYLDTKIDGGIDGVYDKFLLPKKILSTNRSLHLCL